MFEKSILWIIYQLLNVQIAIARAAEGRLNTRSRHARTGLGAALMLAVFAGAATAQTPTKVLIIVAHPDDEYYFAATTYRIAKELGGVVDQFVITNGEGGYKYSSLAEAYYGLPLTQEEVGRRELPAIRKQELLAAGKVIGIRRHYFMDEKDFGYSTDPAPALERWNVARVEEELKEIMTAEHYDFVFSVLPRNDTHGHHRAATILALRAVAALDPANRPVVLAADNEGATFAAGNADFPAAPAFSFDRNTKFGFKNALSYQIVVSWVIAEHKSQGMFQTMHNKHDREFFWIASGQEMGAKGAALVRALSGGAAASAATGAY